MNIGLLTSGGDAPGMNPCLARLVMGAAERGHRTIGYRRGFRGVLEGDFIELSPIDVQGWHKLGGSVLKTSRVAELKEENCQRKIIARLDEDGVDALTVLGGDGSFRAAMDLDRLNPKLNIVGIPCTIDNNIFGSQYTLGHDTAINKLVTYIDDISDTGISMPGRVFFVETLGGWEDYLPHSAVLMGMADFSVLVERPMTNDQICGKVEACLREKKRDYVLATFAEAPGLMLKAAEAVRERLGVSVKCNMIGFQQRGGIPSAVDRLHAGRFAVCTLNAMENKIRGKYLVFSEGGYDYMDLASAKRKKVFDYTDVY
jgi:6-phosphofructokinase 1